MKKFLMITGLLVLGACSSTYKVNGRKGGVSFCSLTTGGCIAEAAEECAKVGQDIDYIRTRAVACSFGVCDYQGMYQCTGSGGGLKPREHKEKIDITIRNR